MRSISPKVALRLASTLALLVVQLPREAMANPFSFVITAVTALEPAITNMVHNLQAKAQTETVTASAAMHIGDPAMNGCGLYLRAQGYGGRVTETWFPSEMEHKCGGKRYRMRMTSQSATYVADKWLGNDQVKKIELHADGWHDTYVNTVCFGLSLRTIVAGPRAFCIDNDLLKACKAATNRWTDLNLDYNDIKFTRTSRGIHKLIISNVPEVVRAMESFDAGDKICANIKLIRGKSSRNSHVCSATRLTRTSHGAGNFFYWDDVTRQEDKNPYGCDRYEGY